MLAAQIIVYNHYFDENSGRKGAGEYQLDCSDKPQSYYTNSCYCILKCFGEFVPGHMVSEGIQTRLSRLQQDVALPPTIT